MSSLGIDEGSLVSKDLQLEKPATISSTHQLLEPDDERVCVHCCSKCSRRGRATDQSNRGPISVAPASRLDLNFLFPLYCYLDVISALRNVPFRNPRKALRPAESTFFCFGSFILNSPKYKREREKTNKTKQRNQNKYSCIVSALVQFHPRVHAASRRSMVAGFSGSSNLTKRDSAIQR